MWYCCCDTMLFSRKLPASGYPPGGHVVREVEVVSEPLSLLFLTGRHVMKTHHKGPFSVDQQGLTGNRR